MANKKSGFGYYQADTDRYLDIKIKRLKSKYGCAGIAVFDYILAAVYRDKGYWVEWDEHLRFDVSDYFNLEETMVDEITLYCVGLRLFNEAIFNRSRILTSSSIQNRFVEMSKTCRRNDYIILTELDIENPQNINIPPNNTHILPRNEAIPPNNEAIPPSNVGSLPQYEGSLPHTNVTNVTNVTKRNVNNVDVPAADSSNGFLPPDDNSEKIDSNFNNNSIQEKQTGRGTPPPDQEKQKKINQNLNERKTTFAKSIWFEKAKFFADCPADWSDWRKNYWYETAKNWSEENETGKGLKKNWISAVVTWNLKDNLQEPIQSSKQAPTNGQFVHPDYNLSPGLAGKSGMYKPQKQQP